MTCVKSITIGPDLAAPTLFDRHNHVIMVSSTSLIDVIEFYACGLWVCAVCIVHCAHAWFIVMRDSKMGCSIMFAKVVIPPIHFGWAYACGWSYKNSRWFGRVISREWRMMCIFLSRLWWFIWMGAINTWSIVGVLVSSIRLLHRHFRTARHRWKQQSPLFRSTVLYITEITNQ